jgi:cytochrome c peroxidase
VILSLSISLLAACASSCTQDDAKGSKAKDAGAMASGREAWNPGASDGKAGPAQPYAPGGDGRTDGKKGGKAYDDDDYGSKTPHGPGQYPGQSPTQSPGDQIPNLKAFADESGFYRTYSLEGAIDLKNPFFASLGTNGRSCGSCHDPRFGWTITPAMAEARFAATDGLDPLFRLVDGSNRPDADVSSPRARRQAYSMLLTKGVIRIGLPVPAAAEFALTAVDDPYGFAGASELSLFRRPLPTANLKFQAAIMWDGRESDGRTIDEALLAQANSATTGHAEGVSLTPAQRRAIVDFQMPLFTAQSYDAAAGDLSAAGGRGGPVALSTQDFFIGINDTEDEESRPGQGNDPDVFKLFDGWARADYTPVGKARAAIARGETLFNRKQFAVDGVGGINDLIGKPLTVTCSGCHYTPSAGNQSDEGFLAIGIGSAFRRTPDMPLYTLKNKATGETIQTSDPGRALITGLWSDIGKFKVPTLRALAARAPYFHDGSAADLAAVVDFYDGRFQIGLTPQEKSDLIAFLRSL